ncbi:hypothetical protein AVEN_206103-1 [Araneus ventricosus]|uniref:Uncharacterized protein n=1 Tax=Araneus ventricosus TaxID=182803 RepID=A0A4Y2JW33_ARAVE|nr:hypothetical protein AVEN_206103-1 [Araneus ventricosus]
MCGEQDIEAHAWMTHSQIECLPQLSHKPSYRSEKALDARLHAGGRYGNRIFHFILGVKNRTSFRLAQIESAEVLSRIILRSKTMPNSRQTQSA